MDFTTSGSRTENTGNNPAPHMLNFSLVSALVITASEFISELVAGNVNTVPEGIPLVVLIRFVRISQGVSPSKTAAADKNLVPSITEPPPTASKKSIFSDFFFFQAEDGIRDLYVTGVQTCALPILRPLRTDLARSSRRCEAALPTRFGFRQTSRTRLRLRAWGGRGRARGLRACHHRRREDRKSVV